MGDPAPGGPPARRPDRRPLRTATAAVLIVLAALLTPLGVLASWVHTEIADTDRYVATVAPLADNPAVQSAVADRVTAEIVRQIPVDSLLNGLVPGGTPLLGDLLKGLGPALTGGVDALVRTGVEDFVRSDAFREVWTDLNRDAHAALDKEVTGAGGGAVRIDGDTVVLDLAPVVARVKASLAASGFAAAGAIPEIHTSYTLVRSAEVGRVRTGLRLLSLAGPWVGVLAVLCGAAGVLAAVHRRRALVAPPQGATAGTRGRGRGVSAVRARIPVRRAAGGGHAR
ncbi:hypothetical protein ACFV0G_21895, partial [Kitasatospora sp. NPDC059571]